MANGNGNGPKGQELRPISQSREQKVQAGLRAYQEAEQEREDFKRIIDELTIRQKSLETELAGEQANRSRLETELESYRRERDHAVGKRAQVEAVFGAVLTLMNKHATETVVDENTSAAGEGAGGEPS